MSKIIKHLLPWVWNKYLLKNDPAGLSEEEIAAADKFIKIHGRPIPDENTFSCPITYDWEHAAYVLHSVFYMEVAYYSFREKRMLKKVLIDALSKQIEYPKKLIQWAAKKNLVSLSNYGEMYNGSFKLKEHCWRCDFFEKYFDNSEERLLVRLKRGSEQTWSATAIKANPHYLQCNFTQYYYNSKEVKMVEADGMFVSPGQVHNVQQWSDGTYHTFREGEITNYHGSPKPWNKGVGKEMVFGCELELLARNHRSELIKVANRHHLFPERDGSLSESLGVEVIAPPFSLKDHQDPEGRWLSFLKDVQKQKVAVGWNAGKDYGLHVSINREPLSNFLTGKIIVFIHSNKSLCERIAGRAANRWANFRSKKISNGKATEGDKYEAISIRSKKRLELRIFRSTTNPRGFLKAVEFAAASVEFCRVSSCLGLTETNFRKWLAEKNNKKLYPNLCHHLGLIKPAKKPTLIVV